MRHPVFESLYDRIPDSLMELATTPNQSCDPGLANCSCWGLICAQRTGPTG